jgi:hypothetical protein
MTHCHVRERERVRAHSHLIRKMCRCWVEHLNAREEMWARCCLNELQIQNTNDEGDDDGCDVDWGASLFPALLPCDSLCLS